MENSKTEMGLIELFIVDAIFLSIFVLFMFIAAVSPADNPVALNLPLVFGGITLPFAGKFGKWLKFIRYHENKKLGVIIRMNADSARWLFFDFSEKGYTWMFRIMSIITMGFSLYHLIMNIIS